MSLWLWAGALALAVVACIAQRGRAKQAAPNYTDDAAAIAQTRKRDNALTWDDYFLSVARLSAMRSKDPSTQVGCCIVTPDRKIVGVGYNGFARGCDDDVLGWGKLEKQDHVVHAEVNAVCNANGPCKDTCAYVTLFPCPDCTKLLVQAGVSEVVYENGNTATTSAVRVMRMAGVRMRKCRVTQTIVIPEG